MITFPYKIVIKKNAIEDLTDIVSELRWKDILIICDPDLKHIGEYVKTNLSGKLFCLYNNEKNRLDTFHINEDVVIGVGGGRIIDIAKYIAYKHNKPWISFPTILSHDGIVSNRAVIKNENVKTSFQASTPSAIIIDVNIIRNAPYKYMAAGAADAISNITAVEDWKISKNEKFNIVAAELALMAAKAVSRHVKDISKLTKHGIEVLAWSLICSGISMIIAGSSRPASGSEHNYSHALDVLNSPLLHGEQVAIGTIISSFLQNKNWKKIASTLQKLKLPLTFKDIEKYYNIKKKIFIEALVIAKDIRNYERYTILNRYNINRNLATQILTDIGFF